MKALLLYLQVTPVFQVVGDDDRPLRVFQPQGPNGEPQVWLIPHAQIDGLKQRVEEFEAQATNELTRAAEEPAAAEGSH